MSKYFDEENENYFYAEKESDCNYQYDIFFYPEIKDIIDEKKRNIIEKEFFSKITDFEEKRKIGQNETYLCKLIRNDSIEEFVVYFSQNNLSHQMTIEPSVFETNSFLLQKEQTLIEYAAFFNSIKIINFLKKSDFNITSSTYLYAIHSNSARLIHLLEEDLNEDDPTIYKKYLKEAVKCHHNSIVNYILNNHIDLNDQEEKEAFKSIYKSFLEYHNYFDLSLFKDLKYMFFYLCRYNYNKLVKFYLQHKSVDINETILNINILKIVCFLFIHIIVSSYKKFK